MSNSQRRSTLGFSCCMWRTDCRSEWNSL